MTALQDHIADLNNPHNVTKTQVGLGNIENYPTATTQEAIDGVANDRYMDATKTQEAIDARIAALGLIVEPFNWYRAKPLPTDNISLRAVEYGNGLFVAVGTNSAGTVGVCFTSPDGIEWTQRTIPNALYTAIVFGNGLFIALGANTTVAATSPDGITWTSITVPIGLWEDAVYSPEESLYVAVGGAGGTNKIITSPDGTNWTARTHPDPTFASKKVTYGNGKFIAGGGSSGPKVIESSDGITWTNVTLNYTSPMSYCTGLAFARGYFVWAGGTGFTLGRSTDGINWEITGYSGSPYQTNDLIFALGQFMGTGIMGSSANEATATYSSDGLNWNYKTINHFGTIKLYSLASNGERAVAVGDGQLTANCVLVTAPVGDLPGPDFFLGGDTTAGFYGEVNPVELIDSLTLASTIGLSAGTAIGALTPWLKFSIDGQVIYVAKQEFRYNIGWDSIYQAGAVYGTGDNGVSPHPSSPTIQDAMILADGTIYDVRLLKGVNSDPVSGTLTQDGTDTHGSEWNRLIYNIIGNQNPGSQVGPNWFNYNLAALGLSAPRFNWCQERYTGGTNLRVLRGNSNYIDAYDAQEGTTSLNQYSWRPVLVPVV